MSACVAVDLELDMLSSEIRYFFSCMIGLVGVSINFSVNNC